MKRLLKLFSTVAVLLFAVACETDMDPFQGGTGLRANINGRAYVMVGAPSGSSYLEMPDANTVSVNVELMCRTNSDICSFSLRLNDPSPLATGRDYTVSNARFGDIPLSGTIRFLTISSEITEAEFELSGSGCDLRHGFLRLK